MQRRASLIPSCLLATWLAFAAVPAMAQPAPTALPQEDAAHAAALQALQADRAAQRRDIERQRNELAARQKPLQAQCYQKFAVEDCLSDLRAQARKHEQPLRERELRLNEEERREKSAERLRSIEQKTNEPRSKPAPMQVTPRKPLTSPGEVPSRTPADVAQERASQQSTAQERAAAHERHVQRQQQDAAARTQSEAQRRSQAQADLQARQQEAQRRQARRDRAVAERKGAPLPVPGQ